jgi:hypothetical protein
VTPLELLTCEQGSELWAKARCGKVTASRCADVGAFTQKHEEKSDRRKYRMELLQERLTGIPVEPYVSREMQWGIDQEPFARAAYEMERDVLVETCGFVLHPKIADFGASPDGLVGEDGLILVMCPATTTQLAWMLSGSIPIEHMPQILAELACTGRRWADFVSYDCRLPRRYQLFVRRYERFEPHIAELERHVRRFQSEMDEMLAALPAEGKGQPVVSIAEWLRKDEVEF